MLEDDVNENENEDIDGDEEDVEGEEGEEKGDSKKLIIIIAVAILAIVGIGAGLHFSGILGGDEATTEEHAEDGEHHDEEGDGHAEEGGDDGHGGGHGDGDGASAFVPIPSMNVNLSTEDDTPRYLRLTVQLELKNAKDSAAVEAVIPRVIDQFQTYLRELRVKDLRGSGGIYRLQMELLWRVNQATAPIEVKDVLFQEILIQ